MIKAQYAVPEKLNTPCSRNTEYGVSTSIGYSVSILLSNTTYSTQKTNMTYPLPLDTVYRSSGTETKILEELIRASQLKKELQEVMAKPILSDNMEKAQTKSNPSIIRPREGNIDEYW
ncbi:hypothetical protein Tco_0138516 [Tanacetum coccineum]